ncbi:MAG: hypothetical protein AAGC57_20230 [Pseudomonadota bacterium]
MALSHRKRTIQLKAETVYGQDPVPVAADALLCRGLSIRPIEGQYQGRDLVDGSLGTKPEELTNIHAGVQFQIEAGGGGAAGTAPIWGKAMLGCGMAEVLTAATSAEYSLISDAYGSVGIVTHVGGANGHRQTILGSRGTVGFTANANELPYFSYNFLGRFAAPVKEAPPAVDYSAHVKPPRVEPANVTAFTIDGTEFKFSQFSIEGGHQTQVNRYANCEEVSMGDRAYTGRLVGAMPAIDVKDLIGAVNAGTLWPMVFTVGTVAGNTISLSAPKVQIKIEGDAYQDAQGDLDITMTLNFTPDAGDDELLWTVT